MRTQADIRADLARASVAYAEACESHITPLELRFAIQEQAGEQWDDLRDELAEALRAVPRPAIPAPTEPDGFICDEPQRVAVETQHDPRFNAFNSHGRHEPIPWP